MDQIFQALLDRGFTASEFKNGDESFFFTAPLREQDVKNVTNHLKPHHWTPQYEHRSLFIGSCNWHDGGMGYYATSHIRGSYRCYRCRTVYTDYDAGNIFASGKTLQECVDNFVAVYDVLEYNRGTPRLVSGS